MKAITKKICALMLSVACLLCLVSVTAYAAVTMTPLTVNTDWVEGTLTAEDTPLFYSVTIPSDGLTSFDFQSFADGVKCEVLSEDMTTTHFDTNVWRASETNPKTESHKEYYSKGTYVLKVTSLSDKLGRVRVKVSHTPADNTEVEPNNDFATAMPLAASAQVKGVLTKNDDTDFYRVTMPAAGPAKFEFVVTNTIHYEIYKADFTSVQSGYCYANYGGQPKSYEFLLDLTAGDYYFKANSDDTGIYYLTFKNTAVQSVSLNTTSLILKNNETAQLVATVNPADAVSDEVEWSTSDQYIAYVGDDGKVTAWGTGVATITVTSKVNPNATATCKVIIKPEQVNGLYQNTSSTKTTSASFSWNNATGADGYRVFKYDASKKKYVKYKDTTKEGLKLTKLKPETKYKFKVAAYIKDGAEKILGPQSAAYTVYTAPKKLGATSITSIKKYKRVGAYNFITVKWKKVKGATGYKVYGKQSGGNWKLLDTTAGCSTKLYAGRGYSYQIKVCAYRTKHSMTTDGSFSKVKTYKSK